MLTLSISSPFLIVFPTRGRDKFLDDTTLEDPKESDLFLFKHTFLFLKIHRLAPVARFNEPRESWRQCIEIRELAPVVQFVCVLRTSKWYIYMHGRTLLQGESHNFLYRRSRWVHAEYGKSENGNTEYILIKHVCCVSTAVLGLLSYNFRWPTDMRNSKNWRNSYASSWQLHSKHLQYMHADNPFFSW